MRNSIKAIAICTLAGSALLTGCGSMTGGTGSTTGNTSTGANQSTSQSSDLHGAPKVKNPIDTAKFLADPCSLLTSSQLRTLNISAPGEPKKAGGNVCQFQDTTTAKRTIITVGGNNAGGLGTFYEKKSTLDVFEPQPDIDGFPVLKFSRIDNSDIGECDFAVGVSDDVAYTISTSVNDKSTPCSPTTQVTNMVLQTLKGGS